MTSPGWSTSRVELPDGRPRSERDLSFRGGRTDCERRSYGYGHRMANDIVGGITFLTTRNVMFAEGDRMASHIAPCSITGRLRL